jgi:hypothetical protein
MAYFGVKKWCGSAWNSGKETVKAALVRPTDAVHNNSLYFCTVFVQMQDNLMRFDHSLAIYLHPGEGQGLKSLSFVAIASTIAGFPLPTLVLTPRWAIFQSVQKELTCVIMKSYLSSIQIKASKCLR